MKTNPSNKSLHEMTAEELGQLFPVVIEEYNSAWPELYRAEEKRIAEAFSPREIVQMDHIGSTAFPGLKAKPTIDILLQISEHLKLQLAEKYKNDREAYTERKSEFIYLCLNKWDR